MCGIISAILLTVPTSLWSNQTLAIMRCNEVRTCNAESTCRENGTRLILGELNDAPDGNRYLVMGPMVEETQGGILFAQDVGWVLGGAEPPSPAIGRATKLTFSEDGKMWALVYRPGNEVAGFKRSDWVRADYECEQVLF